MMQRLLIGAASKPLPLPPEGGSSINSTPQVPPPPPGEAPTSKPGPTPVNISGNAPAATPPPPVSPNIIIGAPSMTSVRPREASTSKPGPTPANTFFSAPAARPPPPVISSPFVGPLNATMTTPTASPPAPPDPVTISTLAAQIYNCTVPAPAPSPHPQPVLLKIMDSYIGSVVATAVAIILLYLPLLHNLIRGDLEQTVALWNSKAIEVGLANNLVWLFYGIIKLQMDMIVGNSWGSSANLAYLLVIFAHKRQIKRACCVVIVMLCAIGALVLFQVGLTNEHNELCEKIFGYGGNMILVLVHFIQIKDLYEATQHRELLSALVSVGPGLVFAVVQSITSFIMHRDQKFIMASCYINLVGYPIEIILLLKMHFSILKRESNRVLRRIQSSFIRRENIGDIETGFGFEDIDEQDETFYEEARRTTPSEGAIELPVTRIYDQTGHIVEVEQTIQPSSSARELERTTLPETNRDTMDENLTEYESAPEDITEEEFPDRMDAADNETGTEDVGGQFSQITVGMVLTEYVIVDPREVKTNMSVLYPWETHPEQNPVEGVGRDDAAGKSGSLKKRKKKTSLAELVGLGGGGPRKRLRLEKTLPLEDEAHAPARRARRLIPSWMSFGCNE